MHWTSLFTGNRRQGWTPVNDVDQDETGMDELMRMAVEGDYEDSPSDSHSWQEQISSTTAHSVEGNDFTEPVFHHVMTSAPRLSCPADETESRSSTPNVSSNLSHPDHVGHNGITRHNHKVGSDRSSCCKSKLVFPKRRWHLILLSVFIPVLFIAVSTGLGVYSLFVYKTDKLVIDKSVKSFSIPNHKVYKNFEAMMLARKDNSSIGRHKREATSPNMDHKRLHNFSRKKRQALLEKEQSMLQQTEDVLKDLNSKGNGFRKSDKLKFVPSLSPPASDYETAPGPKILDRVKRVTHEIGCLFKYQSVVKWKMHVIYLAKGPGESNMFTKERLETVHKIEKKIIQHPGFHNFCLRDPNMAQYDPAVHEMKGCVPVNSLMTYFYPSKDARGHIFYDGMGSNIDDINSALALAMNHETFYYYVDEKINKTYKKSHLLRSEVLFGAPLPGFTCVGDDRQKDVFKEFVITYIDLLSKVSTDKVSVLYGGNEIFDYEVSSSFWSDIRLALVSLIAIFLLLLILSLSLYLTIVGIILIALSFPISLFFYRVVCGINALGILNGAAAFVIIGIGVDDVFVFVNIYRQSSHMRDPVSRIKYTVKTAGVATFFTSFTTAAAFAANLFSSIPAVYEFGLFMSLIVSSCWISVFVLMPPLLYLHACCVEPLEKLMFSCFSCVGVHINSDSDTHEREGQTDLSVLEEDGQVLTLYEDDDDDVPLLDVQDENRDPSNPQDVPLLDVGDQTNNCNHGEATELSVSDELYDTSLVNNDMSNNNMCLGRIIQRCLMFVTHRVVMPGKLLVIGFYIVTLVSSCLLMSRLQPSTHPPQLFRPNTNLQRLLDLKANFSIIDALHCDRCSGLYKVKPSPTHLSSHEKPLSPPPPIPSPPEPLPPPTPAISIHPVNKTDHLDYKTLSSQDANHKTNEGKMNSSSSHSKSSIFDFSWKALTSGLHHLFHRTSKTPASEEKVKTDNNSAKVGDSDVHMRPRASSPDRQLLSKNSHFGSISDGRSESAKDDKDESQVPLQNLFPLSPKSLNENFNVCKEQSCNNLKDRPLMESGATVYVVFGIEGLKRSQDDLGHVLDSFKGSAVFDENFAKAFNFNFLSQSHDDSDGGTAETINFDHVRELCRVCHYLSNQTDLVKKGSAQCLPSRMYKFHKLLLQLEECRDLPQSLSIYHHQAPAHAEGGMDSHNRLIWLAFAFESTTQEGQAYFQAYKQYLRWEAVIEHVKSHLIDPHSPLQTVFQTSEFWTKVMMEVVAVNSAIYGLVLSMLICIVAVAVFTGHLVLLLIVIVTILVMICCVVGIFYLAGWEMGAVEAVSLSILVGSSVDYCVHLVEGYILAGRRMDAGLLRTMPKAVLRHKRTSLAVRHIGVAIICSSLTTIMAAVPLTQTFIQPFTKFGLILLINTTVSMVVTLTLATALLATFAPARFRATWKAHIMAFITVVVVMGLLTLILYLAHVLGVNIPGPSGSMLFA